MNKHEKAFHSHNRRLGFENEKPIILQCLRNILVEIKFTIEVNSKKIKDEANRI